MLLSMVSSARPQRPRVACWTVAVLGIIVALHLDVISGSSRDDDVIERLHLVESRLKSLVTTVEDLEQDLLSDVEKRDDVSASFDDVMTSRHPVWYPGDDKRQAMTGFSAARGKRLEIEEPNYTADLDQLLVNDDSQPSKRNGVYTPAGRRKTGNQRLDYYLKRNPLPTGFSPARGKRFNVDYKRMPPPQGFSSVRGKRYNSLQYPELPPPRGFISVRGKKEHPHNPFYRLMSPPSQFSPKRAPPTGFSHSRGKKSVRDLKEFIEGLKSGEGEQGLTQERPSRAEHRPSRAEHRPNIAEERPSKAEYYKMMIDRLMRAGENH